MEHISPRVESPRGAPDGDAERAVQHIVRVINDGWLALALSLAERLDVPSTLAAHPRSTSAALAHQSGLDKRYLEELLWALVAGGVVTVSPTEHGGEAFSLAPGYEIAMTPAGGPLHWSRITTQIAALAQLEDTLITDFRENSGLPAALYEGHIVDTLAVESGPIFAQALLHEVLPMLDVNEVLDAGGTVVDLGCGTGAALLLLAERFPHSTLMGVDQSATAVGIAAERAADAGLTNVTFVTADLEEEWSWWLDSPADLIMAANVAHDLADPVAMFKRAGTRLAAEGVLYLHELSFGTDMTQNARDEHAVGVLVFGLYHCLPLAKRRPGLAPGGMWGSQRYVDALQASGFDHVKIHRAPSDPNNDTIVARHWRTPVTSTPSPKE